MDAGRRTAMGRRVQRQLVDGSLDTEVLRQPPTRPPPSGTWRMLWARPTTALEEFEAGSGASGASGGDRQGEEMLGVGGEMAAQESAEAALGGRSEASEGFGGAQAERKTSEAEGEHAGAGEGPSCSLAGLAVQTVKES